VQSPALKTLFFQENLYPPHTRPITLPSFLSSLSFNHLYFRKTSEESRGHALARAIARGDRSYARSQILSFFLSFFQSQMQPAWSGRSCPT
jgi:hypothetical protein